MSVDLGEPKGGFTSTYLNKHQMAASAKAIEMADMKPFDWVKWVLLKELVGQGLIPEVEVEAHLLKVERKKTTPHGNSKEARASRAPAQKDEHASRTDELKARARARAARRKAVSSKD